MVVVVVYHCRHNARDRSAKVGNEIKYGTIDYCTCESVCSFQPCME